jgi:hypothetical protein
MGKWKVAAQTSYRIVKIRFLLALGDAGRRRKIIFCWRPISSLRFDSYGTENF